MRNFSEESFGQVIGFVGYGVEVVGVMVIVVGFIWATIVGLRTGWNEGGYREYRRNLAHGMMLGLEFLVAGDIIRTVVVSHSLMDVASLGLVVVIRTVLVFTIHLEVEGRWPWQAAPAKGHSTPQKPT